MSWSYTVDERYAGTLLSYYAGTYDAPNYLNEVYVLAPDDTGYGYGSGGDIDIYSLGILTPGTYTLDVDSYTWDFSKFSFSPNVFAIYDSLGNVVTSSILTSTDLTWTVASQSTYYAGIQSALYFDTQYSVTYTKANSPAVFSNPVTYGTYEVGETITGDVTMADLDLISPNTAYYYWYADGVLVGFDYPTYTITQSDAGKEISFKVSFTDGEGNFELSPLYIGGNVPSVNHAPTLASLTSNYATYVDDSLSASLTTSFDDDNDIITYSLVSNANNGTVVVNSDGSFTYAPNSGYIGADSFEYKISDGLSSSETATVNLNVLSSAANPTESYFGLTGDNLIDASSNGYYWDTDASKTIDFSLSKGWNDEYWLYPETVAEYMSEALQEYAFYIDVDFNFLGYFSDPTEAFEAGSELNLSMDGNDTYFSSDDFWAFGLFPNDTYNSTFYDGATGDLYLNLNSDANYLESYQPGSAGWFLLLHELGHTLGLKHPHDDGGTGRPTFSEIDQLDSDIDFMTVMSYDDDYSWNLIEYDPSTPMVLDVLTLQYIYGKNEQANVGDTTYDVSKLSDYYYLTLWDAGGSDTIDASDTSDGWTILLPNTSLSTLNDESVGLLLPSDQFGSLVVNDDSPSTLSWLLGDFENILGSDYDDTLQGNKLNNTINGGNGNDVYILGGELDDFNFTFGASDTSVTINDANTVIGGTDILTNVEKFYFSNSATFTRDELVIANTKQYSEKIYVAPQEWMTAAFYDAETIGVQFVSNELVMSLDNGYKMVLGFNQTVSENDLGNLIYTDIFDDKNTLLAKAYDFVTYVGDTSNLVNALTSNQELSAIAELTEGDDIYDFDFEGDMVEDYLEAVSLGFTPSSYDVLDGLGGNDTIYSSVWTQSDFEMSINSSGNYVAKFLPTGVSTELINIEYVQLADTEKVTLNEAYLSMNKPAETGTFTRFKDHVLSIFDDSSSASTTSPSNVATALELNNTIYPDSQDPLSLI